ncbi:hypothetical protein LKM01_12650 [Bacillus pacificus]|uniref:hypothetical protein n=1 Tax=Bacillus cereus group TaxID=86661 RepID=UPI0013D8B388|nr:MULTISPECIES: hypothetical protein [Bacillus cereus group]MCC2482683.1 hypothetical protein [Bacillus pacificus]MDK7447165.1 hypothetical protein [Bacillus paranthracis]MDN8630399.1 hypothetical protein [Bacillus paranthracis]MDN8638496.1 hypothetical protein [Bacillus paranthracis]HDR7852006.1 hypothetical protein [Bacillus paranthracis]
MSQKETEEEEIMNITVENEKMTVMNDIRNIIQKAIKEKNLNTEEVIKELGIKNNGK